MPCAIDDEIERLLFEGAQAVVDFSVDFGMRFHILIELEVVMPISVAILR